MTHAINSATSADTATPLSGTSFFEALAMAWGQALDAQAQKITDLSNQIGQASDNPSQLTLLTAESQQFTFLSNSEATSVNAVGDGLATTARKQ
jgi:hypothetical protein